MGDRDYLPTYYVDFHAQVYKRETYDALFSSSARSPKAYVKFYDENSTEYTLAAVENFTINNRIGDLFGSFNLVINKAALYNYRTSAYENLLRPDIRKRIEIYYGLTLSDTTDYIKVFTGIPFGAPEEYTFGNTERLRIKGHSTGYLFETVEGVFINEKYRGTIPVAFTLLDSIDIDYSYTGYSKGLIEYWCNESGIEYILSYRDRIYFEDYTPSFASVTAGLNYLNEVLGPGIIFSIDSQGRLVVRDAYENSLSNLTYNAMIERTTYWPRIKLDDSCIINLEISENSRSIITEAEVHNTTCGIGGVRLSHFPYIDACIYNSKMYQIQGESLENTPLENIEEYVNRYGYNKATIYTPLGTSLFSNNADTRQMMWDVISEGLKHDKVYTIKTNFMPAISLGENILVDSSDYLNIDRCLVLRVEEIKHVFRYGGDDYTTLICYEAPSYYYRDYHFIGAADDDT